MKPQFVFGFLVLCALLCADAQAQKPVCCTPDQWRGEVTSSLFVRTNSSKREFLSDVFHEFIEYDAINRRLRIDFVERDQTTGQQENFTQIFLYQTGTYYFLHGPGTELSRTCVVSSLRPPFNQFEPACVDSEYQSKSQLTMGSPNGEHLTVDSFEYAQHSETAQISSGCWPVTGTFLSHQRQQRRFGRVEAKYYNLRAGVNEESFAVPPACSSESVPSSHTASASKSQKACGCGCHIQSVMYCCPKSAYKECSPTDTGVDCLCNNGTPCIHSCTSS